MSLLAEPEFAAAVDRLPFRPGQKLAVIGESTTDAADSWLEILGHLIRLRRPGDPIALVNAAISGYPTTMLQRVMAETLQRHKPSWVVLFAGANDVLRYGADATKPLVTGAETAWNLAEMRRQAAAAGARVTWMTPTACDTARIAGRCWLSRRRAVAPDLRGYGRTTAPPAIEDYAMVHMVADVAGVLDSLGEDRAVAVGHDRGASVAWACAQRHPDRVAALSVPFQPPPPDPPVALLRRMNATRFNWALYFHNRYRNLDRDWADLGRLGAATVTQRAR